jgi:hypothetical protein
VTVRSSLELVLKANVFYYARHGRHRLVLPVPRAAGTVEVKYVLVLPVLSSELSRVNRP